MEAAPERTRLYFLLGLNCSYYFQDIADLLPAEVQDHADHKVIWRKRSKTRHQNEFETLHTLWPETYALLMRYAAKPNRYGRLLLNRNGEPLQIEEADKKKKSAIKACYERVLRKVAKNGCPEARKYTFKQLRKIGWNAIKRIAHSRDVAQMYGGQVVQGVARMYDKEDYAPVTEALMTWRDELVREGILTVQPSKRTRRTKVKVPKADRR